MPQLRHLLSKDSTDVLRAHQAFMEDPEVVENMTRSDLHTHLAIRTRLGADPREIEAKIERWADMRDVHNLIRKARRESRPVPRD